MAITDSEWARVNALKTGMNVARTELTDAQASKAPGLYPVMQYSGLAIPANTIINWEGQLKRACIALWDREDNDPANLPAMWEDIAYRDGARIIPDVITAPGWGKDELGWWRGSEAAQAGVYRSGMAGNVWAPGTPGVPWTLIE